jgi:cell division protein FtsX
MAATARVASAVRRTARLLVRRPRLAVWATIGVAAAALVFGAALLVADNLDRWTGAWRGGATMVVYLESTAGSDRGEVIAAELAAIPGVVRAEYVPSAEASRRLRAALGADDGLLEGIDPGALPASVELVLEPGARDVVAASPLFATLRGSEAVDAVELVGAWDDRVGALLAGLRAGAWSLAAILGVLAVLAVAATLRLRLAGATDEARVARLLGAGPAFLLAPSILAGALQGAIGAVLALPILFYLHHQLAPSITAALARAIGPAEVAFLSFSGAATIVLAGCAIGAVGGMFAAPATEP